MPRISCITPSIRPEMLEMVGKCLEKQTFSKSNFEWIIVVPNKNIGYRTEELIDFEQINGHWLVEPVKREGDFYNLNKAWNTAFKKVKGELVISIVDGLWFPKDTLQRFWEHYENNPRACISGVGHQYQEVSNGKPEVLVWRDPRFRMDYGSFWEINPIDCELCCTSIPKQAILDVGGVDEEYDRGAACSEKEMCLRMDKAGYRFFIDSSIEYRAIYHPRIGGKEEWDKHYDIACDLLAKHIHEINNGTRLKLDFI